MTNLEAVNEMLEWIGQPPITAITPGGNDESNEAETILLRVAAEVQRTRGWETGITRDLLLELPTIKLGITGSSGTFAWHEAVTESVSGAVGAFAYIDGAFMWLIPVSGTFTGGQTLTGGSSGATRTGTTVATVTSAKHSYSTRHQIIKASEQDGESARIVPRDGFLYDTENQTFLFTDDVTVEVWERIDFDELTPSLAAYITKEAASRFFRFKLGPTVALPADRAREISTTRLAAIRETEELRRGNLLTTPESLEVKGNRYTPPMNVT